MANPIKKDWVLASAHSIAVCVAAWAILNIESLIPTGPEGGWLARTYFEILFALTTIANLALLAHSVWGKRYTWMVRILHFGGISAPFLLLCWTLIRGK